MDEVQNLIMRVAGEMEMKRLNAELAKGQELLEKLLKLQASGANKAVSIQAIAANQLDRNKELAEVTKKLEAASPGKINTQGMQNLGYALQDFVSSGGGFAQKLNSVTNNFQQVALSMGVGGGLFLLITGALAALQTFADNWPTINAYINNLPSPEEIKAKAEAKKAMQDKAAAVLSKPTAEAAAQAEAGQAAITGAGGEVFGGKLGQVLAGGALPLDIVQWQKDHAAELEGLDPMERWAKIQAAAQTSPAGAAKERAAQLVTKATQPGAEGRAAQQQILGIMKAHPEAFSKLDVMQFEGAIGGSGIGIGPPKPEDSEANFALQQKALEAMEGRESQTAPGITYGGRFPGGAPAAPDAGAAADTRAAMQSDRAARAGAMGAGAAGPLIQQPQPRRTGRRRYQQTGAIDPGIAEATQQVYQMINEANMVGEMQRQQAMQPGMQPFLAAQAALQRKMHALIGGPPTGGFTQLPEQW
jgi:hypothetical protein